MSHNILKTACKINIKQCTDVWFDSFIDIYTALITSVM